MKIIFMFLLISSVFCHTPRNPEPKSPRAIIMEEVILKKEPQMLLHFVIDDLILYEKGAKLYLKNTAWRTNSDFSEYLNALLKETYIGISGFEEYLNAPFNQDSIHDVGRIRDYLRGANRIILRNIVHKIDIQPAIEVLESFSSKKSKKNIELLELKMLREEKHGERKKYLDYLYEFTLGHKQLPPPFTYLLERYTEAAAEEERFYEVLKNTTFVNYIDKYLKIADHLRAYKGRTEYESLLGALHSDDEYLFDWAFMEIKKKKISALYEDVFKSCRDSARSNWVICERLLSGETSFDEP